MDTEPTPRTIAFSPPDVTDAEVDAVSEALRSGWVTTGPRTKRFEEALGAFTGAAGVACLNSATAALECALRLLGVGAGDEVVVPAYTYTASASVVAHVGATPVLIDAAPPSDASPASFNVDPAALAAALTPRTKAVIPVDVGGRMCAYPAIFDVLSAHAGFTAANDLQAALGRPAVLADAAHSLGATSAGAASGTVADLTAFSFHAVKNLTTAEGGALAWADGQLAGSGIYERAMHLSLHGQTKDALHKEAGNWEYDITSLGYKWNMTDIAAAMGAAQLDRLPGLLERRRELVARYEANLAGSRVVPMAHAGTNDDGTPFQSSCHLLIARIEGAGEGERNEVIAQMARAGVACNVHYKPLPLFSAYRALGFDAADFPNACALYENEITLPLHTLLSDEDVDYVCECLLNAVGGTRSGQEERA